MYTQVDAKTCSSCKELKGFDSFYIETRTGRYRSQCKVCHKTKSDSQRNPEKRKVYSRKHYLKRKQDNPALFMWKQAKHRAKHDYNDMEFTLLVEDIKVPEVCPYLKQSFIPLDRDLGYSLDRIDSSKGYTKDNIRVISRLANVMKNNATEKQLIAFAKGVLDVHLKEVSCDVHSS